MVIVIIPVIVLLGIILIKQIPKIGGNIFIALIAAGVLSLLLGGVFNPVSWVAALIDGLNRIAWVMMLSIFGSLYSEAQVELGTVDTIMSSLQARFKNSPRALVVSVVLVLVLAGSLLGDAIAASTVVGVLTIGTLASIGLSPEKISAIIVMGASMGSIMPPMTQALALASALVDTDPDPVFRIGYITVGLTVLVVCLYIVFMMMRSTKQVAVESDKKALQIIAEHWKTLIPLCALILVVFFRTVEGGLKFDLMITLLQSIPIGEGSLYTVMAGIPIVSGLTNGIVLCIIFALIVSFLFPKVHKNTGKVFKTGLRNVRMTLVIQVCAGFMLGCFYAGGQIEAVQQFAEGLNSNVLKVGGTAAMCLIGMLTGSQTTTQNVVFSFFGPALVAAGVSPTFAALSGAHLAMSGQGLPPACLTTFVVVGIVGGAVGKKVDPIKSMFWSAPMCVCMLIVGMVLMYI